ncbi:MAG: FG-GAP-like repeat-containing protein [Verrucomicrobiota bacterium]
MGPRPAIAAVLSVMLAGAGWLAATSLSSGAAAAAAPEVPAPTAFTRAATASPSGVAWTELNPRLPAGSQTLFERMPAAQTGVDLVYRFPTNAPFVLLQDQGCATGVCIGDYDQDGWPDIYLTHYNQGNHLYRGLGSWHFQDVTLKANVGGGGRWCCGATFVDIDNDGDLDLYVCVFNGPNLLYLNAGDGSFQEAAQGFGLNFSGASVMMAFADYDHDGFLDGYLVTHRLAVGVDHRLPGTSSAAFQRAIIRTTGPGKVEVNPAYSELFGLIPKASGRSELIIAGQADYLYHNDGKGHFSVVNDRAGIRGHDIGLAACWWDYNDDGFADLYVSNDYKGPDRLYRNNRDGTFTDVAPTVLPHVPWSSMGVDVADIDNDGRIDLIATEMAGSTHYRRMTINGDLPRERWFLSFGEPRQYQRNALYLNTGTERVLEAACLAGLEATDWTWSAKFADMDNDGWMDVFVANGMSRDFVNADSLASMRERGRASSQWHTRPVLREENLAFRNRGDVRFDNVGRAWGLNQLSASFGAAFADLDRDGDLDLIVSNFEEAVSVYRNTGTSGGGVLVRLRGQASNSWGVGAKLQLTAGGLTQTRSIDLSSGIMSANEPIAHFGLTGSSAIDQLRIKWPGGKQQILAGLNAGRLYSIAEPADIAVPPVSPATPWFSEVKQDSLLRHLEHDFDDFAHEPLLPWKLSQLGPGIAVADVDGDGDEDIYLSGPGQEPGQLGLNDGRGQFKSMRVPSFEEDRASEDLGALFFDADGDGDPDLYVVSGGVESMPGDPILRDRLYLNDGAGRFTRAPSGSLPDLRDSGSCVVAADFDRDGDLDLFVGSRCIPGRYPQVPASRLLRNNGGLFVDTTDQAAPALKTIGLVTAAIWSDANDDGWPDLIVTREWNSIAFLPNDHGTLRDPAPAADLANNSGCWSGIAATDWDGDGDTDYLVSNLGLNTPYRASEQRPWTAFVVPLAGQTQFIEACYAGDKLVPVRRRETMLECWPALVEKFPNYQSFAAASLVDILPEQMQKSSPRLTLTKLESGLLLNDGAAHFQFVPMPRLAQISPAFGLVATELDGDGRPDLFLAQNFFSPQPETGRMDGGLGQLLAGRGRDQFAIIGPKLSGLIVPGDAKSVVFADVDSDGRPDLLVGLNNSSVRVFRNQTDPARHIVAVRLRGTKGNPTAVGARVSLKLNDGSAQSAEVHAGSGYLSQSTATLFFGLDVSKRVTEINIRWPDGTRTSETSPLRRYSIIIAQNESPKNRDR